ncbi:DUF6385 domain-containing protein [Dethiobacter alkaliphilus]|uniref:DUF6385 domain-containing protein n=1 Tax=Dethiobacter alkaliphilus TaxID=427926 RepID=UPI002226A010|nr:DUF6385 domain-containing protein [Dethiobacter alkaliphilus]MCW3489269.1 DUF6385 domain-containing protein [Dethiobacter alkaliphilus]
MPNYVVFNREPSQLKTQIFGSDLDNAIATDSQGRLIIAEIVETVSVDIRELTFTEDSIRIYGSEAFPLTTTDDGLLNILQRARFVATDTEDDVETAATDFAGLLASDVSEKTNVSFAVHNTSNEQLSIRVEVSPDETLWILDSEELTLEGEEATVFVPKYFLKYARIAYASLTDGETVTFDAWFQAAV